MSVYFTLAYFFILLLLCYNKRYWLPAFYILGVYIVSLLAGLIVCLNSKTAFDSVSFLPSVLFCSLLTVSFVPFFRKAPVLRIDKGPTFLRRFEFAGYAISFVLIIAAIMLRTKIQEALFIGVVNVRAGMYKDVDVLSGYTTIEHIGHSAIRWLGGLSYSMLLMFFYALAFIPKKYILKVSLLVSSLSPAYFGMLNGGRTHIMYWLLFFIFSLVVFYRDIPRRVKWGAFVVFFIPVLSLVGVYLASISSGRADLSHMDADDMLLSYMGQSYINFCGFISKIDYHPYTLHRIFPFTCDLLGKSPSLDAYRNLIETRTGMDIGIFYTYMGDLFVDMGIGGLIIYVLIVFGFLGKRYCGKKFCSLSDILIIGIFARIILHGLFYYSLYQKEATISVILTIALAIYLRPQKRAVKNPCE